MTPGHSARFGTLAARLLLAALFLGACEEQIGAGGLSRRQCADVVRRIEKLQSGDTGGMITAMQASHGSALDACLEQYTERVFRCVMQADSADELGTCEMLVE